MSVKPVDFQVLIPKTSEVSKIHYDTQNKAAMAHKTQADSIKHNSEQHLHQVYSQDTAQEAMIKPNQQKNQDAQSKKKENKSSKSKQSGKNTKSSSIDIRL